MAKQESGLYVGCALTGKPEAFKQEVEGVKAGVRLLGHRVLDFVGSKPMDPGKVYTYDIGQVTACQAMLAIVDYASLGLGMEIQTAAHLEKPALLVARLGREVTRMATGIAEVVPSFEFQRYEELAEVPDLFDRFLARRLLSHYGAELETASQS